MSGATFEGAVAGLDITPPERLALGRGNAFVVAGHCYHPERRTRRLDVSVGGRRQPVERFRLPREDVFDAAARNGGDPSAQAFRSGFVACPAVGPIEQPERAEL